MTRLLLVFGAVGIVTSQVASGDTVSFRKDVAPILVKRCLSCHNEKKAANDFDLSTFARLRAGGKGHTAETLVPGDPDASYLVESLRPDAEPRMPFRLPPLPATEIATIERWVKEGARFDAGSESSTRLATLVDPLESLPTIAVRPGVSDPAIALVFHPDGRRMYAAIGRTIQEFDIESGRGLRTFNEPSGPLSSLALDSDGSTLFAAGGRAGQFGAWMAWDLHSGKPALARRGHTDAIQSLAVSPDGKGLATASYDRLVQVWAREKESVPRPFKEHTDAAYAVAFSPDGTLLATAGADRNVKLWDVSTGKRLVSLAEASGEVYTLAFSPDGSTLFAAGVDRSIRVYQVKNRAATLARSAFAHDGPVLRVLVTGDGKTLITSSEDRTVRIWDAERLVPIRTVGPLSDWPLGLAVSRDGKRLAIGRYDGSIELADVATGQIRKSLRPAQSLNNEAKVPGAKTPELTRPATLGPISPRGGRLGTPVTLDLSGNGVGRATEIRFDDPEILPEIVSAPKPDPNRLSVRLKIGPKARVGVHRFHVHTPLGTPPAQLFSVTAYPEVPEERPAPGMVKAIPATLVGTIESPGDTDEFQFDATRGVTYTIDCQARGLGSAMEPVLAIVDTTGKTLAESSRDENGADPRLIYRATSDGPLRLRVADALLSGSGNHVFRINLATAPLVSSAFPLGVELGKTTEISIQGANVPASHRVRGEGAPGTLLSLAGAGGQGGPALTIRSVVVAEGPQVVESSETDSVPSTTAIEVPGGVSGRIGLPGDSDLIRFRAKAGQTWIIEVYGRRLGSPIDPVVEILDDKGQPVPRALLRRLFETQVAFRDHPAASRSIRLTQWDSLQIGDYLWGGRELLRLHTLPRNPDDDAVFWGMGIERLSPGERIGMLETTPEHHPLGQSLEKVEILPPGSSIPSGGKPPIVLTYRNDDGGPGFGKDARVTFQAPADGEYLVRVEDVRGLGGEEFGYHLVVRPPNPTYQLSVATENPNIPRGGNAFVTVQAIRIDGFDAPIEVEAFDLPTGVTSTRTTIEPGAFAADLLLMATEDAPPVSPPTWKIRSRPVRQGGESPERWNILDPGGETSGTIRIIPRPNLEVTATPESIVIAPGERIEMTFKVRRGPAFAGRVPIDVRNLPHGVRVLNIGLNGVLVTESQSERNVFLYAEPWVQPQDRVFFASGKAESAGTEHPSRPIRLEVRRKDTPTGNASR